MTTPTDREREKARELAIGFHDDPGYGCVAACVAEYCPTVKEIMLGVEKVIAAARVDAEQEVARLRAALRECTDSAGITYAGWPTEVTEAVAFLSAHYDGQGYGVVDARAVLERHGLLAQPASKERNGG